MFLRSYQRTKQGKTHTYYALVESVRTDAGPRQRVVAHLGELNHDQERRWQRTVVFHNRQGNAQQLRLFPARVLPSGLNATHSTQEECPVRIAVFLPLAGSQSLIVVSW